MSVSLLKSRHGIYYARIRSDRGDPKYSPEIRFSLHTRDKREAWAKIRQRVLDMKPATHAEREPEREHDLYWRGQKLIQQHGLVDPKHHFEFERLTEGFSLQDIEAYVFAVGYDRDHAARGPDEPVPPPLQPGRSSAANRPTARVRTDGDLTQILQEYVHTRRKRVLAGTVMADEGMSMLFVRTLEYRLGRPPRVSDIDAEGIREYCAFLDRARRKTSVDHPLSDQEFAGDPLMPMAEKTKFSHGRAVAGFLSWLSDNHYAVEGDLADIIRSRLPKPKAGRSVSKSFDDDEVRTILTSPNYRNGTFKRPSDFWLPLLGAYSGARQAELLQLNCSDVRQQGGVWVFDIAEEGEDQRLKTGNARRMVPVHRDLITVGLLDYVRQQAQGGASRLFPEEVRTEKGYFQAYSKRFNRMREELGIVSDPRTRKRDFHSFRHAFNRKLKEATVPDYVIKMLMGHSLQTEGMSFAVYGTEPLSPARLAEHICKVDYHLDVGLVVPNGFRQDGVDPAGERTRS